VNIWKWPNSSRRIEICRAETLKLSSQRTEFNTDRNYPLPARRLSIICLGELLNFRSEHAILFGKVSSSGQRIKMSLVEPQTILVRRLNSTLVATIICKLDDVGNGSGRCEKVQKRYCSLYSSGLSIYRMTRPHWPLRHQADSGPGLSGFPILPLREYPAHTQDNHKENKSEENQRK